MDNIKAYEDIKRDILSKINIISKNEGSFADVMVSPVSLELEKNYVLLNQLYNNMFLTNLTSEDLEKKASEYGLIRKNGTKATGTVMIQALKDTKIPKDTLICTSYGLNYLTVNELIFTDSITLEVPIIAEEVGTKYNVSINTINKLPVSIMGIVSVNNTSETNGGTNVETDNELLNRLLLRLRTPATSGNTLHYKLWALDVAGVGDAKIYPLWNGNGTVQVIPITTDKKAPSQELINSVIIKIEEERPLGATVTITSPIEIKINISAKIATKLNANLETIKKTYTEKITEYIKDSVFKSSTVDYNKCLSIFYIIDGIDSVTEFIINNNTTNIQIPEKSIQVIGDITII